MGVSVDQITGKDMLDIAMVMFTYPGMTGCCPEQPSKEYNLKLSVEMC